MSPAQVVQIQFEAYNAHDLEAFLATYSDTAELIKLAGAQQSVSGKAAIAELYRTKVFSVSGHRADLVGRLVLGNKVVDHERVFGLRPEPFEVVAVYEVNNERIERVWLFSAE